MILLVLLLVFNYKPILLTFPFGKQGMEETSENCLSPHHQNRTTVAIFTFLLRALFLHTYLGGGIVVSDGGDPAVKSAT